MSIIILCASHIDSERRFSFLKEMIQSYIAGDHANFYISISFSISEVEIKNYFKKLQEDGIPIYIFYQKEKMKQFEHYRFLSELEFPGDFARNPAGEPSGDPWIVFTDDDDTWHPQRISLIKEYISKVGKNF